MPTLEHNGLIEMFRENPSLAPRLLSLLFHIDVPAGNIPLAAAFSVVPIVLIFLYLGVAKRFGAFDAL